MILEHKQNNFLKRLNHGNIHKMVLIINKYLMWEDIIC